MPVLCLQFHYALYDLDFDFILNLVCSILNLQGWLLMRIFKGWPRAMVFNPQ